MLLRWYVNDLSLQGQFHNPKEFIGALVALVQLRLRSRIIRDQLFCSRAFANRPATPYKTCSETVSTHASREEKQLILSWVTGRGPFIDEDRFYEVDDYFEFEGNDVTDQGLGEAARRMGAGDGAGVFSFCGSPIDFKRDPLTVQHGLSERPIKYIPVANVWKSKDFEVRAIAALPFPGSWQELIDHCRLRYDRLLISEYVIAQLGANTYYSNVAERTIELLRILQEYMENREPGGKERPRAQELHQQYFIGKRARFSDESAANKVEFESEMSFVDPENPAKKFFCPWHGKIQTPQFRIHFEWPIPAHQQRLKVLYIGPKITKG